MEYEFIKGDNEVTVKIGDFSILVHNNDASDGCVKVQLYKLNNDLEEYECVEEDEVHI